uniref:MADF domain-containing protein n=1 Tax=Timema shepardi TaxID=629360 RepID=A0A7R9AMH6_TIMSH|nr:unnamed protein product [Timema shepardi]
MTRTQSIPFISTVRLLQKSPEHKGTRLLRTSVTALSVPETRSKVTLDLIQRCRLPLDCRLCKMSSKVDVKNKDSLGENLFISLIQKHANLYDNRRLDFKNRELKRNSWDEIGKAMGIKGKECENRFTLLRSRYSRILKFMRGNSDNSKYETTEIPWTFVEQMSWLEPFIKNRKTKPAYTRGWPVRPCERESGDELYAETSLSSANINLCRDRGLSPGPLAQKSDTLPLDHQNTLNLKEENLTVSEYGGDSEDVSQMSSPLSEIVFLTTPVHSTVTSSHQEEVRKRGSSIEDPNSTSDNNQDDEYDLFAKFIATQIRTISSKRIRRKVMQKMHVVIGEGQDEDESNG